MSIEFYNFHDWAVNKFGDSEVKINGPEICINSPFVAKYAPDFGHHCWCNVDKNAYHCWKTSEHGSLYRFVAEFHPCDLADADEILGNTNLIRGLEEKIQNMYKSKHVASPDISKSLISLPQEAVPFFDLPNPQKQRVEDYMGKRKLSPIGLYYCNTGRYRDRIIIPYYGSNGGLIYFNGRDISGKSSARYLGPPKEAGVGKGDVLWMKSWPKEGKIYLCEGEFNAMSLCQANLQGAACGGKNLSDRQLLMLHSYDVTFCFDNDKYGQEALHKFSAYKKSFHGGKSTTVSCVLPPKGFKDWNELLIRHSPEVLYHLIVSTEKKLGWDDIDIMRLSL